MESREHLAYAAILPKQAAKLEILGRRAVVSQSCAFEMMAVRRGVDLIFYDHCLQIATACCVLYLLSEAFNLSTQEAAKPTYLVPPTAVLKAAPPIPMYCFLDSIYTRQEI